MGRRAGERERDIATCEQHVGVVAEVQSVGADGSPIYEKVCKNRGQVENQENDEEIATKFADGIKPGVNVMIYAGLPVCVWKGKKLISVFTVTVK